MVWKYGNRYLKAGVSWTDDNGIKHPRNWGIWSEDHKKNIIGLTWENDPAPINDEYYMSLPFNYMVQDGLTVWCPTNVTKFCQWGTPEDLAEHLSWIDYAGKDEGTNCK